MQRKISNVMQSSNVFLDGSKKIDLRKQKDFTSTLKSHGSNNQYKKDFKVKRENLVKGNENKTIDNKENIKNKKEEKDLENPFGNKGKEDTSENYTDKYYLFSNIFNSIDELENKEDLILEEDAIENLNLETLSGLDAENTKESLVNNEEILKNQYFLNITESKEVLGRDEVLEKDLISSLNIDQRELEVKEIKEDSLDLQKVEEGQSSKINNNHEPLIKISKSNVDLVSEENDEKVVEHEKAQLQGPKESLKEESSKGLKEDNNSKDFKLEGFHKDLQKEVEEKPDTRNSFSLNLERQEVKFTGVNDVDVENQEPVDKKQFMENIVEKVKYELGNNKNQMKITLKPESLGEMIMEVEVLKNSLVAKIMVDNQRSKELIENNLFQLKEGVKETGLEIKTFEVFVGNNSDFDKHNFNGFNFKERNQKIKTKAKDKDNEVLVYEDSVQTNKANPLDLYSESSLNLFA